MNPCEKTIEKTLLRNLAKDVFIASPPPPLAPAYSAWSWSRRVPQPGTCFACDSRLSVCFDSRNVQKSVTQIIYLWPLPKTALSPVFGVPDQIPSQPSRIPS